MRSLRLVDTAPGAALVLVAFAALLSLPGLGSLALVRMEAMVAQTATEMLATGDFVIPRVYGEVFTYKPPFLYWLIAGAFEVTGSRGEWAVRLPSALSSLWMALVTLLFTGRIVGYRVGLIAGVASITSGLFLQKLRIAEFDTVLAALVGIAIAAACYALARDDERTSQWAWWICYPALAAALLTKGLPALMLFAPGLLAAAFATGRQRALFRWPHLLGVSTCGVIVAIYLWAAYAAVGREAFRQPIEEATLRGATWSLDAVGQSLLKPLFIWGYFLPWSVALLWGWPRRTVLGEEDRLQRAAWSFLLAGVVVWMMVPTHESRYYLPLAAPLAIASAIGVQRMAGSQSRLGRLLPALLVTAAGTLAVGLAFLPASPVKEPAARVLLLGLGAVSVGVGLAAGSRRSRSALPTAALFLTALCFWAAETIAFGPERAASRDQRQAAAELDPVLAEKEVIWIPYTASLDANYVSLLHYLGRPVRVFDDGGAPPPGASCLLQDVHLELIEPALREPLEPVASISGARQIYRLYRLPGEGP